MKAERAKEVQGKIAGEGRIVDGKYFYWREQAGQVFSRPVTRVSGAIDRLLTLQPKLRLLVFAFVCPDTGAVVEHEVEIESGDNVTFLFRVEGTACLFRRSANDSWSRSDGPLACGVYPLAACASNQERLYVLSWFCQECGEALSALGAGCDGCQDNRGQHAIQ